MVLGGLTSLRTVRRGSAERERAGGENRLLASGRERVTKHPQVGIVVNLARFRKRKARVEGEKRAETNRRLHGRTKAERAREQLQKMQLTRHVDGAKLDAPRDGVLLDDPEPPESA